MPWGEDDDRADGILDLWRHLSIIWTWIGGYASDIALTSTSFVLIGRGKAMLTTAASNLQSWHDYRSWYYITINLIRDNIIPLYALLKELEYQLTLTCASALQHSIILNILCFNLTDPVWHRALAQQCANSTSLQYETLKKQYQLILEDDQPIAIMNTHC
jgi:hypothetical protein